MASKQLVKSCRTIRRIAVAVVCVWAFSSAQIAFAQTECAAGGAGGAAGGGGRIADGGGANGAISGQATQAGQQGFTQIQQLMMFQQLQQAQQRQREMVRSRQLQQAREAARRQQSVNAAALAQANNPKVYRQRKTTAERAAERRAIYFRAREAKLANAQQTDMAEDDEDPETPSIGNTITVAIDQ